MTKIYIQEQEFRTSKTIITALRAARLAITEAGRRQQVAPVADAMLKRRNADLVDVIDAGADALTHDYIVRTRDGNVAVRHGTNPFRDQGPRARLHMRLQREAMKAAGLVAEY